MNTQMDECNRIHHGYIGIALWSVALLAGIMSATTKNQQYRKLAAAISVISGATGTILIWDDWKDVEECVLNNPFTHSL